MVTRIPVGFAFGAAVLLLAAVLVTAAPADAAPNNAPRPASTASLVGKLAPPLSTAHVTGPDPVALDRLRGRVIILDFWATWCGPCQMVMPLLDEMHRRHHGQGLTVLGISNESQHTLRAHLSRSPVSYTIARDTGGTSRRFAVEAIPTLVVVDRNGKVREVMAGLDADRVRELARLVPQLLAEPGP